MIRAARSVVAVLLVVALAAAVVGGCARSQQPAPAKEAEVKTITFVAMEENAQTEPFYRDLIARFEKENPDIKVKLEVWPWEGAKDKLNVKIAAGEEPDLCITGWLYLPEFVGLGAIVPLEDYMPPGFKDRFIESSIRPCTYQGKLWQLPTAASVRVLFYNKDTLEAAGLTKPPETWAELKEYARKLTKGGVYGFGIQGREEETKTYYYYFLLTNGGTILTPDGTWGFNSPEAVEALEFLKSLVDEKLVPEPTAMSREDLQDLFVSKRLAMFCSAPWVANIVKERAPDIRLGMSKLPYNKKVATLAIHNTIQMFKRCKHKDAAWKFVEFLFRDENQLALHKQEGMLPSLKSLMNDSYFQENEFLRAGVEMLEGAVTEPLHPQYKAVTTILVEQLQKCYLGKATPKQALDEAVDRINKVGK